MHQILSICQYDNIYMLFPTEFFSHACLCLPFCAHAASMVAAHGGPLNEAWGSVMVSHSISKFQQSETYENPNTLKSKLFTHSFTETYLQVHNQGYIQYNN